MTTMKKLFKILLGLLVGIVIIGAGIQTYLLRGTRGISLTKAEYRSDVHYSSTPTILIPGWGGNTVTYQKLINYYQNRHIAQKTLTVWISPWGNIRVAGRLNKGDKNALIQILYDWNYDSTFHPQVKQLSKALTYLHDHYHLDRANVIAHSYGGTEFMHAYLSSPQLQKHLQLNKVVFLGVPVEESLSSRLNYHYHLIKHSRDKNFIRLRKQAKDWQPNGKLTIYNFMGTKPGSTHTDGEVPLIQSEMLKSLIKDHPTIQYHQRVYSQTTHRQLHDRTAILNRIADELWMKE